MSGIGEKQGKARRVSTLSDSRPGGLPCGPCLSSRHGPLEDAMTVSDERLEVSASGPSSSWRSPCPAGRSPGRPRGSKPGTLAGNLLRRARVQWIRGAYEMSARILAFDSARGAGGRVKMVPMTSTAPVAERSDWQGDERAVTRFLAGDVTGFEQIVRHYSSMVFCLASRLVGVNEAEDVVQETFLR